MALHIDRKCSGEKPRAAGLRLQHNQSATSIRDCDAPLNATSIIVPNQTSVHRRSPYPVLCSRFYRLLKLCHAWYDLSEFSALRAASLIKTTLLARKVFHPRIYMRFGGLRSSSTSHWLSPEPLPVGSGSPPVDHPLQISMPQGSFISRRVARPY